MQRVRRNTSTLGDLLKKIAFFDYFAGCGGAAEGARQAGALVVLAVDCWEDANNVHRHNHPSTTVLNFEIGEDPEYEKRLLVGQFRLWRSRGYHIHFHCSPPCQALSQASSTKAEEGMGLVNHCLWLIDQVKPDSWSMENVVPMRKRLPENIQSVVLNAADFGVPQTRKRCIAGEGWFAKPTHSKDPFNMLGLPLWLSVADALPHLKEEFAGLRMDAGRSKGSYSGKIINKETGERAWRDLPPISRSVDEPSYTIMGGARKLFVNADGCGSSESNRACSADSNIKDPMMTIRGSVGPPSIRSKEDKPIKIRSLTIQETAILQSFPPAYSFEKGRLQKSRWTMIGNAVPPLMMKAIVEGIQ